MASDNENSTTGNPIPSKQVYEDQNITSPNAHDQTLLMALQNLIVRVTDMDPMEKNDRHQTHLGPEAGKLITALQEFISSVVVYSQSRGQNTVEVSLDEEDDSSNGEDDKSSRKRASLPMISSSESPGNSIENINSRIPNILEKPHPTFEEGLLRALREHVFNKMPIRLLCFESHGSSLEITLLERGALFTRLASMLQGKIHENKFRPKKLRRGKMETEEEVIKRLVSKYAGYAILSHTWLRTAPGEVTYSDWKKGPFNSKDPGYRKLVKFCRAAWKGHGLAFGWMDTVCIDKESSSELDESIRSMYNWYSRATVCITYLAETDTIGDMHLDPWFTRGWTLQELLAPPVIKFYNGHWKRLIDCTDNDKRNTDIRNEIERATSISKAELDDIRRIPISRRMQLAATREVTREEDTAYSLMGIFDVNISTAYGEGVGRAFFRLLQEIMASSPGVLDILNWAGEVPSSRPHKSRILPSSPKDYINRSSDSSLRFQPPMEPLTLTHLGLRVPVVLMPGISISKAENSLSSFGEYSATVDYSRSTGFFVYSSSIPTTYNILDNRIIFGGDGWTKDHSWYQLTFAVFNFGGVSSDICLPKTCIAIPLKCSTISDEIVNAGGHIRIRTSEPIVFTLGRVSKLTDDVDSLGFWFTKTDELAKHGMRLLNLYL